MANASDDEIDPMSDEQLSPPGWGHPVKWRRDFARGRQEERQRLLAYAREVFGDPLAEVILTHAPADLIGLSAAASTLSDDDLRPLRNAVSVADELSQQASASTIRAWFAGLNPMLDDQEPALVIRDNPSAVRDAAKAFLAASW